MSIFFKNEQFKISESKLESIVEILNADQGETATGMYIPDLYVFFSADVSSKDLK